MAILQSRYAVRISIHAPVKGATITTRDVRMGKMHFNPRSREGSDVRPSGCLLPFGISIHAPVKGATTPV